MIDEILLLIMALAPSLTSIFTTLGMVITVLKNFKQLKEDIKSREELEDIKSRFKKILDENYELKQLIKELLEKVDGIKRTNQESEE